MPGRNSMRRIRESLRLRFECGLNQSETSRSMNCGRGSIQDYWQRFDRSGKTWQEVSVLSESELEALLYSKADKESRGLPDFQHVHAELSRVGVTLYLLWEEYSRDHPDCYSYTRFCELYGEWRKGLRVYMRQNHIGGRVMYVDYSGKKPTIVDPATGEIKEVELFVMVWGASHRFYAEIQADQSLANWLMGHVRGFEYFGCAPYSTVPDNYKGAVSKAHWYDPDLNRSYSELAEHYQFAVLPARPRKPKDKAKAEVGVLIVQRWILARLRNRTFFSIAEFNEAVRELLEEADRKLLRKLKKSRLELFEEIDKPNARSLPPTRYIYHQWCQATVHMDYHVEVEKHYYSVPYSYYGKKVDVRISESLVEIFYRGERIASHERSRKQYASTTDVHHMPLSHQKHAEWTPQRILDWAEKAGKDTRKLIEKIFASKSFPEQGFRPTLGILRLGKVHGAQRLESAAGFALAHGYYRVREITEILKKGLDQQPKEQSVKSVENKTNIRGPAYFTPVLALEATSFTPIQEEIGP